MRPTRPQPHTLRPARKALAALASLSAAASLGASAWGPAAGVAEAAHAGRPPHAHTARTVYLREYARLRSTRSEQESSISELGNATGTFAGPLSARLTVSAEHVSALFTFHPRGGSVIGRASARFVIRGHTGYYGGTLKIIHGTGAYRHASGSSIGISGTIDRDSFALVVKANGWVKY
jgi:hypothetical protein